jgi:hypothetical protein
VPTTPAPTTVPAAEPEIRINDALIVEGDDNRTVAVRVWLTGPAPSDVTIEYVTSNGNALVGVDYLRARGTLTIPAGSTRADVEVVVLGDNLDEETERFAVNLFNPSGATLVDSIGRVSIVDDDDGETTTEQPSIVVNDVTFTETNESQRVSVIIQVAGQPDGDITVDIAAIAGTAVEGEDYLFIPSTEVIPQGRTGHVVSWTLLADADPENDEQFVIRLSNANGATITDTEAVVTIRDDD